jgi:hypothetical protein
MEGISLHIVARGISLYIFADFLCCRVWQNLDSRIRGPLKYFNEYAERTADRIEAKVRTRAESTFRGLVIL